MIKEISNRHNTSVAVAVQAQCADAFKNVPWIKQIIHIKEMGHGIKLFNKNNYISYQITNNIKFPEFVKQDPNHSLIDTVSLTGLQLGITIDQKPLFFPTDKEMAVINNFNERPIIAIESIYKSGQSWAKQSDFDLIIDRYRKTHKILWLSNQNAPDVCDNLLRYTRREIIMLLQMVDIFFSVGSGFFCGCMALPKKSQPKKIICLWIDAVYKYEKRLSELQWHDNIIWVHNKTELNVILNDSKL